MQTFDDVYGRVAAMAGDPDKDWLTPAYFTPICNQVYEQQIEYLDGTCSPYIEKVVIILGVPVSTNESNLVPYNAQGGVAGTPNRPLARLVKPRYIDYRQSGQLGNCWRPAKEFSILPDGPQQITANTFDIRVRGNFLPPPLLKSTDEVLIHPNMGHALAYGIMAVIGMERPNAAWVQNYGLQATNTLQEIAAALVRQQQRLTFRLGSPNNQGGGRGWNLALQGCLGWEFRSFQLFVKLI
jgi:hypothetical protein